jgi:hypothetical protein
MTKPDQFTFIPCESGAKPRCIGKEYRKRIRAQAMRTSWSQKKESKNARAQYQPIHKAPGIPFCHTLLEDRQCCTASTFRSILALGSTKSNVEGDSASRNDVPRSVHAVHLFMRRQKSLCHGTGDHSHTSVGLGLPSPHEPPASDDDIVETRNIRWVEEEYLGLPACSPSCCGVDPFTSSIAPINLRMHSYLQYYLDHVLPILHPVQEQTAILKDALLAQLNRSPLVLYSTLSIASLRVDNYSNRYDELLLYSKWTDSQLPVPHSFRFKTKTVHLLLHAMKNPGTESVPYVVFALIGLITYELLVENIQEAKIHFRGLRNLLRSHGGLERICAADVTSSTISEMRNVVHEMERYAEHCLDDDGQQPFLYRPDEEALSRYLAADSRFPTLIGQAPHAPDGLDWFAVDRQSAEIVDEMVATECFWHMGCRNDKSLVLKALIGIDGHGPLDVRNMSELDRPCYSTVDKLSDENEANSPLTRHALSEVHDCFR